MGKADDAEDRKDQRQAQRHEPVDDADDQPVGDLAGDEGSVDTQLFAGSAKAKAAAISTTASIPNAVDHPPVRSGVRAQSTATPSGPIAAPDMAPTNPALDVSRSRAR